MTRQCGDCQLCCTLLPVNDLGKAANERCRFQKFRKGCSVYRGPEMPVCCTMWSCRWLTNEDTANLSRPDRTRYVVDGMPDFIEAMNGTEQIKIMAVQIWVDPRYRDAWRDPDLLAYLDRRGQEGVVAIIRYSSEDSFIVVPPSISGEGFVERHDALSVGRDHTAAEILEAVAGDVVL